MGPTGHQVPFHVKAHVLSSWGYEGGPTTFPATYAQMQTATSAVPLSHSPSSHRPW